ncbi:bifunctional UDP-sugar hydrolase/5'-nucleotidase UshA [Enterobacter hormaechei]|uniref:bifunctional UDP-sugar hydrolase/5'-nucleotidase UshA n=1 Tax=Enterobacter hormaechei TaxID=158836 RepID=UPI003F54CE66
MRLLKQLFHNKIIFFLIYIVSFASPAHANNSVSFTILHTNDHHGAYWEDSQGHGGLANRHSLVEDIRNEVAGQGGFVLLLDAGDVNTGTPESDLMLAEPDFKGMSLLGYDAMTLGNHEFDNSLDILKHQQSMVDFSFLSANIYHHSTGQRAFKPYQIFKRQGLSIGVFGLTTVQTKTVGSKNNLVDLDFRPHAIEAKKVLAEMQKDKLDVVIALTHLGYYKDGNYGSNEPGDVSLARELLPGSVDMIIGGHSHTAVCMNGTSLSSNRKDEASCQPDRQNGIWIFQALESGKYLGRADFTWQDGKLILNRYQLIPVVAVENRSSPVQQTYTLLESYKKQSDQQLATPVGLIKETLQGDRDVVRNRQTNLGELIIQAQIDKTDADFGIISSGSIRSSIDVGVVSYRDVLKAQPFGNSVTYVDLTGREVFDYLKVVLLKKAGSGAYAQYHNIDFSIEDESVTNIKIKGVPLDMQKNYRMSLPSYNASGGDGYPELNQHPSFVNTGYIDAEVLKTFISRQYPANK